jgi:hypothetical protein
VAAAPVREPASLSQIKPEPEKLSPVAFTPTSRVAYDPSANGSLGEFLETVPDGSVVDLPSGVIEGEFVIKRSVYLLGNETTLSASGNVPVIECATTAVLENVGIVQSSEGSCVVVSSGALRFLRCVLRGGQKPLVTADPGTFLDIESCDLRESQGASVLANGDARVRIALTAIVGGAGQGVMIEGEAIADIEGSQISGQTGVALACAGTSNVRLVASEIFGSQAAAVQITANNTITIRQCRIHDVPCGISATGKVGVDVANCEFSNCSTAAIQADNGAAVRSRATVYVDAPENVLVVSTAMSLIDTEGDRYTGSGKAAISASTRGRIDAREIVIEDQPSGGILLYDQGGLALKTSVVRRTGKFGISARQGARLEIENVLFEGATGDGIVAQAGTVGFLRSCKFSDSTIGAEITGSPELEVIGCDFSGNKSAGLALQGASTELIRDCTFSRNGQIAVDLMGSKCKTSFENCTITDNPVGFSVTQGATGSVTGGSLTASEVCINVSGSVFTARSIALGGTRDAAVTACSSARVTIEQCTIQQNENYGIQAFDLAHVKAVQCLFSSGVDIFCLKKAKVRCVLSKFEGSQQVHVQVQEEGVVSLKECELLGCQRGVGMQISDGGLVKMKGSHLHNEPQFGIAVCGGGKLKAIQSAFYDCGVGGLYIDAETDVELVGCQILRNGKVGVQALGGKVVLTNCAVKEHPQVGILQKPAATVQETNTEFAGNGHDTYVQ